MFPQQDPAAMHAAMGFLALLPLFIVIGVVVVMVPTWFICRKAGFSPWLSLLMLVPLGNLVLLYVLAFSEWRVVPLDQVAWPPYPPPYPPAPPGQS